MSCLKSQLVREWEVEAADLRASEEQKLKPTILCLNSELAAEKEKSADLKLELAAKERKSAGLKEKSADLKLELAAEERKSAGLKLTSARMQTQLEHW